jgi:hypothetical protein
MPSIKIYFFLRYLNLYLLVNCQIKQIQNINQPKKNEI